MGLERELAELSLARLFVVIWLTRQLKEALGREPIGLLATRAALCDALVLSAPLGEALFGQRRGLIDRLLAPIDVLLLPFLLILVEPDLGTSGIVFLVGMSMILVVGIRRASLIWLGLQGIAVAAMGWLVVLRTIKNKRILTFQSGPGHSWCGLECLSNR